MSRYTRQLRKQARAQKQGPQTTGSSATAVLEPTGRRPPEGGGRTEAGPPVPALGRELAGTAGGRELAGTAGGRELAGAVGGIHSPVVRAIAPSTPPRETPVLPPERRSLPERDVAPGHSPGHPPSNSPGQAQGQSPGDLPRQRRQPDNDRWLWRDKILVGDLVVLVGEEGAGKTRLLADWIARVTAGQPFPGTSDPSQALPPSDVLVFNSVDDFAHDVLAEVAVNGGDPARVWQATTPLLDWGHSHGEFPAENLPRPGLDAGETPVTRVRLHTQEILAKLRQFLLRRPSIRLVVIDQLKQHLRTDSERVFEEIIYDLQALARELEVPFVLTQRPDAFRNATGIKQYFKSDSLTSVARSIWRVAQPEELAHGHRVLQCLKLNHGYGDQGKEPWRLWQEPGQPMRWQPGTGEEFPLGKLDARQRLVFHAKTFISLYLQMFGGLADFETLRFWGRQEGISRSKLFEAATVYNLGFHFEPCAESESGLRQVIGSWEQIRQRQAQPLAERSALIQPPRPKRRKKPTPIAVVDQAGEAGSGPAAQDIPAPAPRPTPTQTTPTQTSPAQTNLAQTTPTSRSAELLESLRARVARGEARLREFDLEGFRFIKPNLTLCHMLLNLEEELGSEEAVLDHLRQGLRAVDPDLADDLESFLGEYRQLFRIARQVEAQGELATAA